MSGERKPISAEEFIQLIKDNPLVEDREVTDDVNLNGSRLPELATKMIRNCTFNYIYLTGNFKEFRFYHCNMEGLTTELESFNLVELHNCSVEILKLRSGELVKDFLQTVLLSARNKIKRAEVAGCYNRCRFYEDGEIDNLEVNALINQLEIDSDFSIKYCQRISGKYASIVWTRNQIHPKAINANFVNANVHELFITNPGNGSMVFQDIEVSKEIKN